MNHAAHVIMVVAGLIFFALLVIAVLQYLHERRRDAPAAFPVRTDPTIGEPVYVPQPNEVVPGPTPEQAAAAQPVNQPGTGLPLAPAPGAGPYTPGSTPQGIGPRP